MGERVLLHSHVPQDTDVYPSQGIDNNHLSSYQANVNAAISAGATHLLGFNEPDLGAQSNLSPQQAADPWKKYVQPFAGRVKLVSPAVMNGGPPRAWPGWTHSLSLAPAAQSMRSRFTFMIPRRTLPTSRTISRQVSISSPVSRLRGSTAR
jgi:hypothetical protein